jgi:hypothetical protein
VARIRGGGNAKLNNLFFSGIVGKNAEQKEGVGMLLNRAAKNSLMDWKPISEMIITACFRTNSLVL